VQITKPDDAMLWLTSTVSGGQPLGCLTVAYLVEADGTCVDEPAAWRSLLDIFGGQPFDEGQKKARGTFAVAGNACAPAGTAVHGLRVHARVGAAEKTLHVYGERRWHKTLYGWRQTSPALFDTMPLDRRRAFGGAGWAPNPDGRGFCAGEQMLDATLLPNVVAPAEPIVAPGDRPGAASVATLWPLPCSVPQRARYLGATGAHWLATQYPHWPQDTDSRYFDAVAEDQCIAGYWRGDETYEVHGMHARHASIEGRLPGLRPRLLCRVASPAKPRTAVGPGPAGAGVTDNIDHAKDTNNTNNAGDTGDTDDTQASVIREVPVQLDTVWLLPNQQRVLVCYRGWCATAQIDNADLAGVYIDTERLDRPAAAIGELAARWHERVAGAGPASMESAGLQAPAPASVGAAAAGSAETALETVLAARTRAILAAHGAAFAQASAIAARHGVALGAPGELAVPVAPARLPAWRPPPGEASVRRAIGAALADAQRRFDSALEGALADLPASARGAVTPRPGTARATQPTDLAALRTTILDVPLPEALRRRLVDALSEAERAVEAIEGAVASATKGTPGSAGDTGLFAARRATAAATATVGLTAAARATAAVDTATVAGAMGTADGLDASEHAPSAGAAGHVVNAARRPFDAAAIRAAQARGAALSRIAVYDADLAGIDLRGADLSGSEFMRCDFTGARLERARLCDARIVACRFDEVHADRLQAAQLMAKDSSWRGARLTRCDLTAARCERCDFTGADLSGATLAALQFIGGALREARLHGTLAPRAVLRGVACAGLDAAGADLTAALIERCDARAARFTGALLAGSSWWGVAAPRVDFAGANLANARSGADCNFDQADFSAADLRRAGLRDTVFTGAVLRRARLDDASFANCNLGAVDARGASAERADFNGSDLGAGHWRGANLMHAALRRTRLDGTDFSAANLHGADVSGAHGARLSLDGALLTRCRLGEAGYWPKAPA
jgi:uncharacterized protein YjbI with pentapeptide repeats